jgi:hypothetical protein
MESENEIRAKECERIADYLDKISVLYDGPLALHLSLQDKTHAFTLRARARTLRSLDGRADDSL